MTVTVPHAASDEACGQFSERHRGLQLWQPLASVVQLVAELPLYRLGLAPVRGAGGLVVTDAVDPDVGPPCVTSLEERHGSFTSFPLLVKNPCDDLVAIEEELAHRPRAQVRESLRQVAMAHRPRRTADERCNLADPERLAEGLAHLRVMLRVALPEGIVRKPQ